MKKPKLPVWKTKKRLSFHFYFIFFVVVTICVSVGIALGFSTLFGDFFETTLKIPNFVLLIILSLIIGGVLSYFVGKFILYPIKKIRNAMNEVSQGNFNVTISEESRFDEIEDISHSFNLMTKELRSIEVIQTDFISNVSHEFKTPITAVEGYTAMLASDDLSKEERAEYAYKVSYNLKRMTDLVNNILLLSKIDNQA
ncbi:MAG: HAMP domain-containing histidine kinase [Clostridia bacterium]|nr:HAMP domain-containing histidine kinase [Clostridia bacterium]